MRRMALSLAVLLALSAGCARNGTPSTRERAVVTTTWLECALRDTVGDAFDVVRLSPPGSCPGHFDMKPSQMVQVRNSRFLLRFDFQEGLDEKLGPACGKGLTIVPVTPGEGMCVPETYFRSCRQIAQGLSAQDEKLRESCVRALVYTKTRLDALANEVHDEMKKAGLAGRKVVASRHQAAFCRWLGLEVVDTFGAEEADNSRALARVIEAAGEGRVTLVVANLQEGDRQAKALAQRLGAKVVVFSNFPDMSEGESTFDDLVRGNVRRLVEASQP